MKLSLVIPCYNEAGNLPGLVDRCKELMLDPRIEILLVDNGSTDGTAPILDMIARSDPSFRIVRVPVNKGYGHGIVSGLRAADGDILAWTHADHQTNPNDVLTGFAFFLESDAPETLFVKGRRHGRPIIDRLFTSGMSLFETLLVGRLMSDINAQPTMFHRCFFETWSNPPSDFALDLYAYWRAQRANLAFRRFFVRFGPRTFGKSHWNTGLLGRWRFIRRTLEFSLRMRLRSPS